MIWLLGGYIWLFIHRPFEVWPMLGTLQIERVYMCMTLLVWMLSPNKSWQFNRTHLAMILFSFAVVFTWVSSPFAGTPAVINTVENFFKVAVFYVLVVTSIRTERDLRQLVMLFLASVFLYASHSLLERINGRMEYRMGISRMVGVDLTYGDPNAFGSGLVLALAMTVPFWMERPLRVPKPALLGFCGLLCVCILLTGSRSAFVVIAVLLAMVFLSFAKNTTQAVILIGVAGLLGLGLLAVALPDELKNRYMTLLNPSLGPKNAQQSAEGRVMGFQAGVALFMASPLTGSGPGSFLQAAKIGIQPHNVYGQVMGEMGLNGVIALMALCACIFLNWMESRRLYARLQALSPGDVQGRAPPLSYLVSIMVSIATVVLLIQGVAGHNLYRFHWQWFAAFQAAAVNCLRLRVQSMQQAAYATPYMILPPPRTGPRRARVPVAPRR
jgi:O-antigen ligase